MPNYTKRYGPWALVTGCAREQGLGYGFARQLAAGGQDLVLVDVAGDELKLRAQALRERHGVEVRVAEIDMGARDCLEQVVAATEGCELGLLVANHVFAPYQPPRFLDMSLATHEQMLDVNARAYTRLIHTFGRRFVARGRGGIVIVSSASALVTAPFTAGYAANKAYQLALGEALWYELRGTGVDIQVLTPGLVRTELPGMAGFSRRMMMEVDQVVAESLRQLGRRHRLIPGRLNRLLIGLQTRLLPRRLAVRQVGDLMAKSMKVE